MTDTPSKRYREVAHRYLEYARLENSEVVPDPATPDEISAAEVALGCRFPDSYRWFQLELGRVENDLLDICSVKRGESDTKNIVEANIDARGDSYAPLPTHLIAFSDSSYDLYCFDTSAAKRGECPVVWWDREHDGTQRPQRVSASFLDWLEAEVRERAAEAKSAHIKGVTNIIAAFAREVFRNRVK
jgi:hypothetical protein